jgi:hypothetical protein
LLLANKAPQLFTRLIAISPNYLVSGIAAYEIFLVKILKRILVSLNGIGFNFRKLLMQINLTLDDIGITETELKSIQTNVKILYAQWDSIKLEHLRTMAQLIPNATLDMVKRSNHQSIFNNRDAIEMMRNFLLGKY